MCMIQLNFGRVSISKYKKYIRKYLYMEFLVFELLVIPFGYKHVYTLNLTHIFIKQARRIKVSFGLLEILYYNPKG